MASFDSLEELRDQKRVYLATRTKLTGEKSKIEEVKHLKKLKRQEIMEQLERLRKTAGTDALPLKLEDITDDFDPEEHDRLMQAAFGDDYYATKDEEEPEFSDDDIIDQPIDEDIDNDDLANWDDWTGDNNTEAADKDEQEDDDKPGPSKRVISDNDTQKKRKRPGSLMKEALARKKPVFDPNSKKFEEYFDEYYKMDFEDLIAGDVRCRFKYRNVQPNDFGLSTEEILAAKDKELNAWVSVKKMSQYRTRDEEVFEQKAYRDKGRDIMKKKRLLQSVYQEKEETPEKKEKKSKVKFQQGVSSHQQPKPATETLENVKKFQQVASSQQEQPSTATASSAEGTKKKKKRKNRKKKKKIDANDIEEALAQKVEKKKERRANTWERKTNLVERLSNERLAAYGVNAKKLKNRVKYSKKNY